LAYLRDAVDLFDLDAGILEAAASVQPVGLRTLDAIHLATALSLRDDLAAVVSYDRRLAEAALAAGLPVVSPS
jgi:predicted nucleic acid-binding protein